MTGSPGSSGEAEIGKKSNSVGLGWDVSAFTNNSLVLVPGVQDFYYVIQFGDGDGASMHSFSCGGN